MYFTSVYLLVQREAAAPGERSKGETAAEPQKETPLAFTILYL